MLSFCDPESNKSLSNTSLEHLQPEFLPFEVMLHPFQNLLEDGTLKLEHEEVAYAKQVLVNDYGRWISHGNLIKMELEKLTKRFASEKLKPNTT
ncbi:hypothetical protein TNCT_361051 [Trichonephila clavata]|uniref:Uncharacterized protein n=1 Tax=Trichonephila clavata TaxID=2740835 RepID=A0A8X6HE50_TRICU|nr:hypothetical protein TNCT_361051 [Trichonephila clavata]